MAFIHIVFRFEILSHNIHVQPKKSTSHLSHLCIPHQPILRLRPIKVCSTIGLTYLIEPPISFSHAEFFALAYGLFFPPSPLQRENLSAAEERFIPQNSTGYRDRFLGQPGTDKVSGRYQGPITSCYRRNTCCSVLWRSDRPNHCLDVLK